MERILFITANRVGDAILSTGLLRHLLATRPDAAFTIACGPAAAGVFARMPRRERTIIVQKRPWNRHWPGLWRAAAGVRWTDAIDLRGSALTYGLRADRRWVMRSRPGPKVAQLAAVLGLSPPPLPVAWFDAADAAFADARVPPGALVLAPTANWAGKMWPADRFVAVARAWPNLPVAVLAGPGETERAAAHAVSAALPGATDLAGALTLPQAAALLSGASLFVGNDSGPMHLAAAAGAPTIGLFGPTSADEYAPAGPRAVAVRANGRDMDTLPVAAVVAAARALLSGGAALAVGSGAQHPLQFGRAGRG